MAKTWWLIESNEKEFPYRSGCFATRAEARFRLGQMAESSFYSEDAIVRRADDFFSVRRGTTYRVIKW